MSLGGRCPVPLKYAVYPERRLGSASMWNQLPRATVYQRCSMLMKSVSCNFWAKQMSVPKISALNLSKLLSLFSLHCCYLSLWLSAYVSVCLQIYFLFLSFLLFIYLCASVLPTIRVWQSEVNATADIGQPAMLTCAVDGYPEPMVTWTR